MKVETSVSRNRKFVKAGPGPSWLWVCGLAYCQEGLTDGFISSEALPYLGVKSAPNMVKHLVTAGLWDVAEGGWRIHDYLEHNKTASIVRGITEERRKAGANGGTASGLARREADAKQVASVVAEASREAMVEAPVEPRSDRADRSDQRRTERPHLDVAFRSFQEAYPEHRRKGGHLMEIAFIDQAHIAGSAAALMSALENHKISEQWADSKLIPGMDTWLTEERWRQTLPPKGTDGGSSSKMPKWLQDAKAARKAAGLQG